MAKDFNFVNVDSQGIYDKVIDGLMDYLDEPLYPGDERRLFAEALVMVLVSVYNKMNDTAKQKMLQYARGDVLDAIGEMDNTPRLMPTAAHDTVRFSVQEPIGQNVIIPSGTRVTPDGEVFFSTLSATVLQAGKSYADVEVYCQTLGSEYNGLAPGTINVLVDVIPYIYSVSNIYGTIGGDDGEPYTEAGDDRYRERIKLAHSSFSVAGPVEAYKYFALSADPEISDVQVVSPEGHKINIYVLMAGGNIPDAETLQKVAGIVSADDVRPMTDEVTVLPPDQVPYGIEIKYYTTLDNEPEAVEVVEGLGGAIDQYNEWQVAKMGRDINPDQLKKHILAPSAAVDRVDVVAPAFTTVGTNQVAVFNGQLTISHEVVSA